MSAALSAMQQQMQQQQEMIVQQQAAHAQEMANLQQQLASQQQHAQQAMAHQAHQAQQAQQAHLALQAQHAQQAQLAPRSSSIRPTQVAEYSGKIGTLDAWVASMEQQFEFHNQTTDAEWIRTAAVMLRGPALAWWQTIPPSDPERSSWVRMQVALYARFQPVDDENVTRAKLLALKQGGGATGISDYISSFRSLLVGVKTMGEADKLFFFMQGMREDVARFVRMSTPTTLVAAEATAIRIGVASQPMSAHAAASLSAPMEVNHVNDDEGIDTSLMSHEEVLLRLNAMMSRDRDRRPAATTGMGARGAQGARGPPQRTEWPSYSGRTVDDIKKLMAERKCFECGKTGHSARECPLKSKN